MLWILLMWSENVELFHKDAVGATATDLIFTSTWRYLDGNRPPGSDYFCAVWRKLLFFVNPTATALSCWGNNWPSSDCGSASSRIWPRFGDLALVVVNCAHYEELFWTAAVFGCVCSRVMIEGRVWFTATSKSTMKCQLARISGSNVCPFRFHVSR